MPRKKDLREVDQVALDFGIRGLARSRFGKFLETCKHHGDVGSKNDKGDFTRPELEQKAKEFLGLPDED